MGEERTAAEKIFQHLRPSVYALGLKDKLPGMTEEEQLALLATDGMLVKRPVLVGENFVLVGFKAEQWEPALKNL